MSFIMTGVLRRYALSKNLLDVPNIRSSHASPIPRGGGLAIVLTSMTGLILLSSLDVLELSVLWAFLGAGIFVATIGLFDDLGHISPQWRLFVHFISALWVFTILGGISPLSFFGIVLNAGWAGDLIALICLVWLINLYNFMDGIDGIAASEAIFITGAGFLFASMVSHGELQWVAIILMASSLGFLFWNWPPAKIFMGDVGSGFLGVMLGIYAWWSVNEGVTSIWTWLIIFGVFMVDSTITLVRRFVKGLTWYEAHRSHAYQHASRRWGHLRVTVSVFLINVFWLLPIAYLTQVFPYWGPALVVLALAPLTMLVLWLGAGLEEDSKSGH